MEWTMPRPAVQAAAVLLVLAAVGSFAMGVINAPDRGRMPGERAPGASVTIGGAAIQATEATPLSQERIEAAPKPVEKATNKADDEDEAADQSATNATPSTATNTTPSGATNATLITPPPPDLNATLPQEEPPH